MKKVISIVLSAVLSLVIIMGMAGCMMEKPLPEYESEYFKYAVRTKNDGTQVAYLTGFTELGQQQTELILPEYIEGFRVSGLGYRKGGGTAAIEVGLFRSENLKRLYIPYSLDDWTLLSAWSAGGAIIYIEGRLVQWKGSWIWNKGGGEKIIGYNILKDCFDQLVTKFNKLVSNVAYMINYEVDGDDGYYWVDSYDNDIISYIPPDPVREGYKFKGWYKEAECLNEWDFATDKTGDEIPIIDDSNIEDYDDSGITYLYAGWEKE